MTLSLLIYILSPIFIILGFIVLYFALKPDIKIKIMIAVGLVYVLAGALALLLFEWLPLLIGFLIVLVLLLFFRK